MINHFPYLFMLIMAFLGGTLLGLPFLDGWTLTKSLRSSSAGAWFFGNSIFRTVVVLVGIFLITYGQWPRLVACLLGFILARILVVQWQRPHASNLSLAKEVDNAP